MYADVIYTKKLSEFQFKAVEEENQHHTGSLWTRTPLVEIKQIKVFLVSHIFH